MSYTEVWPETSPAVNSGLKLRCYWDGCPCKLSFAGGYWLAVLDKVPTLQHRGAPDTGLGTGHNVDRAGRLSSGISGHTLLAEIGMSQFLLPAAAGLTSNSHRSRK